MEAKGTQSQGTDLHQARAESLAHNQILVQGNTTQFQPSYMSVICLNKM